MTVSSPGSEAHYREVLRRIMKAALDAVDPEAAVLRNLRISGSSLLVGAQAYELDNIERIVLVGGGKAGAPMAKAIISLLGDRLSACVINVKEGYTLAPEEATQVSRSAACEIEIIEAGHPTPNQTGVKGAQRMVQALSGLSKRDLVICVISGGGSALMTLPVEDVALEDMQALTELLLRSGATINEVNTIRKHLSQIKGGNLARLAQPARLVTLILSDVVGNPLDVIASGPTVPDTTTYADAWAVLEKYDLVHEAPQSVVTHLRQGLEGKIVETPKPGDPIFKRVQTLLIGSNDIAAARAVQEAKEQGLQAMLLTTYVEGEAREVAKVAAALAKQMTMADQPLHKPACLVLGGETTVTVRGNGMGGRNQELALAAALALDGWQNVLVGTLATDGTDGPTDGAGAIVSGATACRAREMGLDPLEYLQNNDSYNFFKQTGELLVTGPTNTNVNDLLFVLSH